MCKKLPQIKMNLKLRKVRINKAQVIKNQSIMNKAHPKIDIKDLLQIIIKLIQNQINQVSKSLFKKNHQIKNLSHRFRKANHQ